MTSLITKTYQRFDFELNRSRNYLKAYLLFLKTFFYKECYFGPFVGEFGHLLSHVIPFISYLHSKGIKVHYCGPEIHYPYFFDNDNKLIVNSFQKLRDFYSEVSPIANDQIFPDDVKKDINNFINKAQSSGLPFWDIRTREFYWNTFCRWEYLNGFIKIYRPENKKNINTESSVVVFARKKGEYSPVRGEDWDFQELVNEIKSLVPKVYVLGHPAFSHIIEETDNVEVTLTSDNSLILEKCKKADLIINQLSGTHYLGIYADTRVLLLLKGEIDNSNIQKDNKFRKKLKEKYPLEYAYSLEDVKSVVANLNIQP